jgi:hypothetical protein
LRWGSSVIIIAHSIVIIIARSVVVVTTGSVVVIAAAATATAEQAKREGQCKQKNQQAGEAE